MWDALVAIWEAFLQFLRAVVAPAEGVQWLALGFGIASLVIYAIRRGEAKVTLRTLIAPLIIWGVSWPVNWLLDATAGGAISEWLLPLYPLFVLVSLVWAFFNLLRVVLNK